MERSCAGSWVRAFRSLTTVMKCFEPVMIDELFGLQRNVRGRRVRVIDIKKWYVITLHMK
jgi:hypothetical protein